ncbi:NAD-binding protein [Syncephalastrum racemosum]|uniref:NAD-binding protein n=1 Tax=Syncephalastrum racemosum TaxID=13706 RepID=A0A1X2HL46_SYNRA|nr:NAD-binding protein [Syncephalastrum racemosum]
MVRVVLKSTPKAGTDYKYSAVVVEDSEYPKQGSSQDALVNLQAVAFNHRDLWILKGLYPGIVPESVLGSDAVGTLQGATSKLAEGRRVLLNPGHGWISRKAGPENKFSILGLLPDVGTFADKVAIDEDELVACPDHLSTVEAAALPLAGLTAYRALFTKGEVEAGDHVLITGIGGGVALFALQFAVAAGANVYVSSSSDEKIQKAIELGAKGGINYKDDDCIDKLKAKLGDNRLSAIIDGAGGPLYGEYHKVLNLGAKVVQYGHTASPQGVTFNAQYWIKNVDFRGSTMGSRREFHEMVAFVDRHKIKPIVSHTWKGLNQENVDDACNVMDNSDQFGKLVIQL